MATPPRQVLPGTTYAIPVHQSHVPNKRVVQIDEYSLHTASGRAMAIDEAHGFVKVITDQKDGRVLGIHIVGPEASDLISEGSLAIEMGAYAEDIGLTIHPHPTLGEAVMEAAKHAVGEAIHIPNRKKKKAKA